MKTLFIVLSLLFGGASITKAFADDEIILQIIDPGEFGHGGIKSPPMVLVVTQNYNILTLSSMEVFPSIICFKHAIDNVFIPCSRTAYSSISTSWAC